LKKKKNKNLGRNLIQVNQKKHLKSNTSHQTENGTEEQVKEPTKLPPKSQTKALTNSNTVESQHQTKNIEAVHGKKEREPSLRPFDKHLRCKHETTQCSRNLGCTTKQRTIFGRKKQKRRSNNRKKISRGQPDTGEPHKAPKRKRTCKKNYTS
jgi:hypothetical protein